jgi:RNA polymerase sigma-70 factor, ECF subfamily
MSIRFAYHEEQPIHAFAGILAKKNQEYKSYNDRRQELEASPKDFLSNFNTLVLHYQNEAYNFAFYLLGDPDTAADATQQAFINAYLHFHQFTGANFRSWFFKILKNVCIDELRREKRRRAISLNTFEDDMNLVSESIRLAGRAPTPEQTLDQNEKSAQIQGALRRLDEPFRTVLILVDIQGMDYLEAAQVINVPLGTLKSRLARARQQFRGIIEQ